MEDNENPVSNPAYVTADGRILTLIGHINGYDINQAAKGDFLYVSTAILKSPNPALKSMPVYTLSEAGASVDDQASSYAPSTIDAAERAMRRIEAKQALGIYTSRWRDEVSAGRSGQPLSPEVTDAELADPEYMRAYIAEMRATYVEGATYWRERALSAEKFVPEGYVFTPNKENEGEEK